MVRTLNGGIAISYIIQYISVGHQRPQTWRHIQLVSNEFLRPYMQLVYCPQYTP